MVGNIPVVGISMVRQLFCYCALTLRKTSDHQNLSEWSKETNRKELFKTPLKNVLSESAQCDAMPITLDLNFEMIWNDHISVISSDIWSFKSI